MTDIATPDAAPMDLIKLVAFDSEDLEIVSAHLQDAVVAVGDIIWLPAEKRLVIALNRFDWVGALAAKPLCRRRRAALRFERVEAFKVRGIDAGAKAEILSLLTIEFSEAAPPGGNVILNFSGGGALRLEVECVEAELADLGPAWAAVRCPGHPDPQLDEVETAPA
jgi:hypothetical protein